MAHKPRIIDRRVVAQSRIFRVEALDLEFANGARTQYERLVGGSGGAVLIVPMLDAETVLLIREYAAGSERYELGLPKGRIERGEEILAAANREIMEEIGHGSRRLECLTALSLAPGYMSHRTHIVLARELYPKRLPGDEPEEIEVVPWSLNAIDDLIEREDFSEARSLAALYLTRDRLLRPSPQ
ncbi:ADP compounds hydrolase NudE [Acidihalobacter ferrooxydans]|uniref:ADP compounds hydrolase NudE n=1 Tax=Acidihalobacter ferrooxydans TaxID=1765967 RepID=A0A1P8UKG8_9GAMM|nr:ADP compounds hydrolase NudE [Acidihalobacter ferrooxydans]APZ44294.1 ADP compounds hydrolase NudE [Acidihalobacter ferrooxydans]